MAEIKKKQQKPQITSPTMTQKRKRKKLSNRPYFTSPSKATITKILGLLFIICNDCILYFLFDQLQSPSNCWQFYAANLSKRRSYSNKKNTKY